MDFELEAGGTRTLTAGFDAGILRNGGGNGVGKLFREPVHDVIHTETSSPPPGLKNRGVLPESIRRPSEAAVIGRQKL